MFKKNFATVAILAVVIFSSFLFSFQRIGHFTGGDETLWSYGRVPDFWHAIATQNWKKTSVSDKPGVTLVLLSGIGLPFIPDPGPYQNLMYSSKTPAQLKTIEDIYFHLRLPILIFSLASLVVFFLLVRKLLGAKIALISVVFIGLSPILVGMSIYINSDSLLWIFFPLTILSFLLYQKFISQKYLILTGIFLGLALLTKYVAVILFPFLFVLIFLKYIFDTDVSENNPFAYFKKALLDYLLLMLISSVIIFLLFPQLWVNPGNILEFTIASRPFLKIWPLFLGILLVFLFDIIVLKKYFINKIGNFALKYRMILIKVICFLALGLIFFTIVNTYTGMKMLDFPSLLNDPRTGANQNGLIHVNPRIFENILASFYSLIFGLTPIVVIAFIFTPVIILKTKQDLLLSKKNDSLLIATYFIFFILAYYIASSLLGVSSIVRYQVSLYPIASIVAAIGLAHTLEFGKIKSLFKFNRFYILIISLILLSGYSLYLIRPFYLEYSSVFLPKKYFLNTDNLGDESWNIAQYLNNLPNASNLYIWTDSRQVCEKFIGKCAFGLKGWNLKDVNFDYFVVPVIEKDNNVSYKNNSNEIKIGSSSFNFVNLYSPDGACDFKFEIDGRKITTVKVIKSDSNNNLFAE